MTVKSASGAYADSDARAGFTPYWRPSFWPVWVLWLWMQLTARVPVPLAIRVHEAIGRLLYALPTRVRSVVRLNLRLTFKDLDDEELDRLARRHFAAVAAGFAECAIAWCASDRHIKDRFDVVGIEHLHEALARGKGVILYTGHFTGLEIFGRPLKWLIPHFACMYSPRSNPLLDEIQRRGRLRCAHESIPSDRVRSMLACLKRNGVVWYAPDQAPLGNKAVLVPFFSEPAMMTTATTKLARLTGAAVMPFSYRRIHDSTRYRLEFFPSLGDFPSDDETADTLRLAKLLETLVREAPEQYLWTQKKFRGRPGMPDPYRRNAVTEPTAPGT